MDRGGLLLRSDVSREWADIDVSLRQHFIQMMDKYDVSYRVTDSESDAVAIVVERLPWNPPDYTELWDSVMAKSGSSQVRVRYGLSGHVPPGIPTWFIARSHRFTTNTHWRTGALLRHGDGEHYGLITCNPERSSIELAVRGPLPAAFFSLLDDGLQVTLARYPGLKITRWVPCPCEPCCSTEYDYMKIRDRHKKGRSTVECERSLRDVGIVEMLFGVASARHDLASHELIDAINENFDRRATQILQAVDRQTELLQREFMKTRTMIAKGHEIRCPSVFTISGERVSLPGMSVHTLRLYCEEPGAWHPLPGDEGCYTVVQFDNWARAVLPHLRRIHRALSAAVPLAGAVLGIAAPELHSRISDDLDKMKDVLSSVEKVQVPGGDLTGLDSGWDHPSRQTTSDAGYRAIENLLSGLDKDREWGGLSRVATPEGLILYVCSDHLGTYR